MGLFQRRASVDNNGHGSVATAEPEAETAPEELAHSDPQPSLTLTSSVPAGSSPPPFGLADFPPLPLGAALWSDAIANVVQLQAVVPRLPNSLLVLVGPTCQAAAIVTGGAIIDAVWVNADGGLLGDAAAHALMTSDAGTLTAHVVDDARIASVLPLLWRWPRFGGGLPAAWLHTDDLVAEVRASGRSCGLLVTAADPGAALFDNGELVAVYTRAHPWPMKSVAALWNLLHATGARVTVVGDSGHGSAGNPQEAVAFVLDAGAAASTAAPVEETAAVADAPDAAVAKAPDDAFDEQQPTADSVDQPSDVVAVDAAPDADTAAIQETTEPAEDADTAISAAVAEEVPADTEPAAVAGSPAADALLEAIEPAAGEEPDSDETVALTATDNEPAWGPEEASPMEVVEALKAAEFVAPRLDIDVEALRAELTEIAVVWLGAEDSAPVAAAIGSARGGVDDFVSAIAQIGAMEIPGHEHAFVRAMAREMHFRASEVLCGV